MPNHSVSIISYLSYDYGLSSLKQFLTESQIGCKHTWTETRITTSFHDIQRVPPPGYGRTFCTQCSWSNMQEKNSKLHRYQQESELKRKKNNNNNNCIPLSTGLIFTREKPPFCHLPIVSMKASKRLEKYKLWFLKSENLSVLLYLFSRFFNYHVHLSYHQSVPSYLRIRRSRYLAKPTRLTKLFQMILWTKSHFDKTLTVIFKCGYCI